MTNATATTTLRHPRKGWSIDYPADWQMTRLYPSATPPESAPEVDFGFAIDERASDPDGWLGVWFNRMPPHALRLPQLMVLAHELPALRFEAFADAMREKLTRMGGTELRREDGLTLAGLPAGEYAYALGARRIRLRLTWYEGLRLAVFFAGDERAHLIASRGFDQLAAGLRVNTEEKR
ncbi:MAG: hypothetical protein WBV82_30155 [Myxococcaceae bacterium]